MIRKLIKTKDGSNSFYIEELNETYHSIFGAITESKHVFINNGLLQCKNKNINILEVGFGTGLNALLTAFEAEKNKLNIFYQTLEAYPLDKTEYSQLNYSDILNNSNNIFKNLHECRWEESNIINQNFKFKKNKIKIQEFKSNKKFDIIYFDAFAPEKQSDIWKENIFVLLNNLLKIKGFLVTYCAKGSIKRLLKKVGFEVKTIKGPPGKREMIMAIQK